MISDMKTTVEISDALLREARNLALREDVALCARNEEGLRQVLAQRRLRREPFRLRKATFRGRGLTAEARAAGREGLLELTYEGRGG
jgi:hypothetical protein